MGGLPIFPSPLALFGPHRIDPAAQYQDWNVLGQFVNRNIATLGTDPFANGAFGDGTHDDTAALQQTINQTGVLYLRPEKVFKITATITIPTTPFLIYIYGGGQITSTTATPLLSMTGGVNLFVENVILSQSTAAGTAFSLASNASFLVNFNNVYISSTATCLALNSNGAQAIKISSCTFTGATTGIALTTQTDVLISNCQFRGSIIPVTTSGACTYTLRGCGDSVPDVYPAAQTSATATAGGGAALPATVRTFITVDVVIAGVLTQVKIPAFNV